MLELKDAGGAGGTPELSPELKKLNQEVHSALDQLKTGLTAKNEETVTNVKNWLNEYDEKAQKYARELKAHQDLVEDLKKRAENAEAKNGEVQDKVRDLEIAIATKGSGVANAERESAEYKSFFAVIAAGGDTSQVEKKDLRTDSGVSGGFLVPTIMDTELRKNITEISPVRRHARVRPAQGKSIEIVRRLKLARAYYEGEAKPATKGENEYGTETITLHRLPHQWGATQDMLDFSAFDLEREINADMSEAFGLAESVNFVKGTGVKSPQGFQMDGRIQEIETAAAGAVDWNDLAEVTGHLKRGQNPWWFFNRRTLSHLFQINDADGRPIWSPVKDGAPAQIWGYPYDSEFIDMDEAQAGSGAKPITFGDMRRAYEIYDRTTTIAVRDQYTRAAEGVIVWTFTRYNDGRVVVPEALKRLKIK